MSRKNDNEELTSCNNLCKNCKFFDFEEKQGVCYLTRQYTFVEPFQVACDAFTTQDEQDYYDSVDDYSDWN